MDDFGVLDQLIFNHETTRSAEPIARMLGMVHLYRASGVHLLAFFSFLEFAILWILKSIGFDAKRGRLVTLGVVSITIFWIWRLQDFRLALIRPIFTFLIRIFFKHRGARAQVLLPLLLTFCFEFLLSQKTSVSAPAFHYYLSVAGGLLAYALAKQESAWKRHLALAVGSWIPIAVWTLARDHVVSYLTPLFSLLTIPIISLFLYPLTLIDLFLHGQISSGVVQLWNGFLRFLFSVPDLGPTFASVSGLAVWMSLPFAIVFGIGYSKMRRPLIPIMMFCLGFATLGRAARAEWDRRREVIQLDVGQGDAAVFRDATGRVEMIDVGSAKTYAADLWLEKLSKRHLTRIDSILLTHLDEDHVGALKELVNLVNISCVQTHRSHWQSERGIKLSSWLHEHSPRTRLAEGDCMTLPEISWFRSKRGGGNELMAGSTFPLSAHLVYFALGDGDESQELAYETYFQSQLVKAPERIWKISHHGSRFSSNYGFLKRLNAKEFWISVGKHNPYHHPNPLTLLKLSTLAGEIHRTDEEGDIVRSFKE